jgi:hypothetical protein
MTKYTNRYINNLEFTQKEIFVAEFEICYNSSGEAEKTKPQEKHVMSLPRLQMGAW